MVLICAFVSVTAVAEQEKATFASLIPVAEAVVVVEILATDYSRTPADGPMVADAKVLKVMKGSLKKYQRFRFEETAWVGPNYQQGEHRVLFLERSRRNFWRVLSNLYAKSDFFIEKDALPELTLNSLRSALERVPASGARKIIINKDLLK